MIEFVNKKILASSAISPSVSIIVPIYKSELFLKECINSILNQTYSNWELILIDDGSPDKSGSICDDFSSKDSRIKTIHQKNQGVSVARNVGLSQATGKYICFVDSDDRIEVDYLSSFFIKGEEADLYLQGYKIIGANGNVLHQISFRNIDKSNESDFISVYTFSERSHIFNSPCFRLFKRKIIIENNLTFDTNISFGEDHIFSLNFLQYAQSISFSSHMGYLYIRRGQESLTSTNISHKTFYYYAECSFNLRERSCNKLNIEDNSFLIFIEAERNLYIVRAILALLDKKMTSESEKKEYLNLYLNKLSPAISIRYIPGIYKVPFAICKYGSMSFIPGFLKLYSRINKFRLILKNI